MELMEDKRALNTMEGHMVFSTILYVIFYFILQGYVNVDYKLFIFGFGFYLLGSVVLDKVERNNKNPWHRGFWHSFTFMTIIVFIIIPLFLIQYYFIKDSNNFIAIIFFFFGILSHALPDAVTKRSIFNDLK